MAFPYKLHRLAYIEYIDAYEWYENKLAGLGEKFIVAVDKRVDEICDNPEYYSYCHGQFRQVTLEDFPYTITYKFFPKRKLVYISSIHHHSRNSKSKFRKEI